MPLPLVAIVGRPNVGKSTLFNRILKRRIAVVDPSPGVTRDRHYATTQWEGVEFRLVDTGGFMHDGDGDVLAGAIREQTIVAAEEADLVLMVADAQAAPDDVERELIRILLKQNVPMIYTANKTDDTSQVGQAWELRQVGAGDPFPVSAKTGYRVAELLDEVVMKLREIKPVLPEKGDLTELSLAIIGAPNTGKSSLVNRLAQSERMVVSDIAGTTRDSVDTLIRYHGSTIRLIDTAGLKRKRFGQRGLEFYCTIRSLRALDSCEVAAVMIDAEAGLTNGDLKLVAEAVQHGTGVMIVVNKWDLVEKDYKTADDWLAEWKRRAPRLNWAPVHFISALTGQRSIKVIETALNIKEERSRRIATSELNDTIVPLLMRTPPPAIKGKQIKIKYLAQVQTSPPRFACFSSYPGLVREQYKRFVERLIRERYSFRGVPISVVFRNK